MSWVDIVLGGGITLGGTGVAELLRAKAASSDRSAKRQDAAQDYQRATLKTLRDTASTYRDQLTEYHRESEGGVAVSDDTDRKLRAARMAFQSILYEASDEIISAMEDWESAALKWSQRDGGAAAEDRLWKVAVKACGAQSRSTHKIK